MPLNQSTHSMHQHIEPHRQREEAISDFDGTDQETRRQFLKDGVRLLFGATLAQNLAHADDSPHPSTMNHTDHNEAELQRLIDKHWDEQNDAFKKIAERGVGFQGYYDSLKQKEKAFFTKKEIEAGHGKCECCSDEGIRHYHPKESQNDMLLVRTPGSGVLQALDKEHQNPFAADFIDDTATEALEAGVTVFTSHAGCGAFKAVYNNWLKKEGKQEASAEELDKKAAEWANLVVKKMKLLAPEKADTLSSDFIEHLDRPKSMHIARCLYLTDLDEFNGKGLPPGFVERTGRKMNLKDILDHADVLRKIAFDPHHGFGTKFTTDAAEQFVICCVTDTQERLDILTRKAQDAMSALDPEVCGKIRVEGLLKK